MLEWLAPLATGAGVFAWRSWHRDAAIRSGELMDVRDLMPAGDARLELRALQDRLYRIELQLELAPRSPDDAPQAAQQIGRGPAEIELAVHRIAADPPATSARGAGDTRSRAPVDALVHSSQLPLATRLREAVRAGIASEGTHRGSLQGALPLLELQTDALVRLRFDVTLSQPRVVVERGGRPTAMRVVKAHAVIKERVRPLRLPKGALERVQVAAREAI